MDTELVFLLQRLQGCEHKKSSRFSSACSLVKLKDSGCYEYGRCTQQKLRVENGGGETDGRNIDGGYTHTDKQCFQSLNITSEWLCSTSADSPYKGGTAEAVMEREHSGESKRTD